MIEREAELKKKARNKIFVTDPADEKQESIAF